jgi:hypothetical protein
MAHSLKDLLGDAVRRAQISREVTAAQIIEIATETVQKWLPEGRKTDAWAGSFRDGIVTVFCLNASAMQAVSLHAGDIADTIKRRLPTASITRIVPRLSVGERQES